MLHARTEKHGKAVQRYKALGIAVMIKFTGCERSKLLGVQREFGTAACVNQVALIETQAHFAGEEFLCARKESLKRLTKRRKPLALVEQRGKFLAECMLGLKCLPVQNQSFQTTLCLQQYRDRGDFIDAAGFHADHAVFHKIVDADAVVSAELIQAAEEFRESQFLAV